jgi:NADH-quinone oxidoreductase subunit L
MGAGAIIIAMHHEQNIFKMGGLKGRMKLVYITMFIATLAISGIPPFAGFFSKDAILVTAFAGEHYFIWIVGSTTAALTSFYMFRLLFTVFHSPVEGRRILQKVPKSMTYPLVILAFGSATAGLLGVNAAYGGNSLINNFLLLPDTVHHLPHSTEYMIGALNVSLGFVGMLFAYKMFAFSKHEPTKELLFTRVALRKFYVDEIYEYLIVKPLVKISYFIAKVIDPKIFDGFINLNVWFYLSAAKLFTRLQNAKVRYYALYILAGVSGMSIFLIYKLGVAL